MWVCVVLAVNSSKIKRNKSHKCWFVTLLIQAVSGSRQSAAPLKKPPATPWTDGSIITS